MPKKIFIGGLSINTTNPTILANFSSYGTIVSYGVKYDGNGVPLGNAEVEYATDQAGTNAIAGKNGAIIDGQRISVVGR
jgi:RNA recognition motif-containing protein